MTAATLSNHADCEHQIGAGCRFAEQPRISLYTGNAIAPKVDIFICENCGHGVTRPEMPDVRPLYEGRESEDFLARDTGWILALKHFVFTRLARKVTGYAGSPQVVADYGTGNGMLASALATVLPCSDQVYGLDFFDDAPSGIGSARYLSFDAAAKLIGTVDLLTCFHVLEHDDSPHEMLRRLTAFVRPGGVLVVEVPNVDCVWTPWFGQACANWYAPFHRVHFSRQSLLNLFKAHDLELIGMKDVCGPTFALSFANALNVRPNSLTFAAAVALRPIQWIAEKATRRPSALRIIARKGVSKW